MAAKFYVEQFGIDAVEATRIAAFMELAQGQAACQKANPWAKHGKARVYFTVTSQNKMPAIEFLDKSFYDASENEVYFVRVLGGRDAIHPLSVIVNLERRMYSGAKTRRWLQEFSEAFYGQKANWD